MTSRVCSQQGKQVTTVRCLLRPAVNMLPWGRLRHARKHANSRAQIATCTPCTDLNPPSHFRIASTR